MITLPHCPAHCRSEANVVGERWEAQAVNWIAWARAPGHDSVWDYAPAFFDDVVLRPGERTLEIGCGEGRVARGLSDRGHRVTAIDASRTLIRAAREMDVRPTYARCDAAVLPFASRSFDLVVAYNSLMDMDDMPGAVAEAARVLMPAGRFCVCVTHPIADSGRFEERDAQAAFRITDTYFGRRRFLETFQRAGLTMTFDGWSYPLEDYAAAFERAGLAIELLREPKASGAAIERDAAEERWARVPSFLFLRALKTRDPH